MKLTRSESRRIAIQRQAKRYAMLVQVDEEGDYVVGYPDLPGCMAHGPTIGEAMASASVARGLWTEVALEEGLPIREPRDIVDLLRVYTDKPARKGRTA